MSNPLRVALPVNERRQHTGRPDEGDEGRILAATRYWQPTTATYLGRVSKDRILEAVHEGVSAEAAQAIAGLKKQKWPMPPCNGWKEPRRHRCE
jgi:ParB family transcriptional regulator, chromosome partitioning protein